MKITHTSELMQNFRQSAVIAAQKKFNALHTQDGHALLFSIGTDGTFYLIEEQSGKSTHGWELIPLSQGLRGQAKSFGVAQNPKNGKLDLALIMKHGSDNTLYLSSNHNHADGTLTANIDWTAIPYDGSVDVGEHMTIDDVFISNSHNKEYMVADIVVDNFLKRHYIDPDNSSRTGKRWNLMSIGGDLNPDVISTMGRKKKERVDGIYTLGEINGERELLYAQLYNPFGGTPSITRFKLPKKASALATATVDETHGYTDLFVTAGDALYYFPHDAQKDQAAGTKVLEDKLFNGTQTLFADATSDEFIVWGLDEAKNVFYTRVARANVKDSSAWTPVITIIDKVEHVSPYVNGAHDAKSFFSASGNTIHHSVQSGTTMWKTQTVELKSPAKDKPKQFSSYTTRIQLTDDEGHVISADKKTHRFPEVMLSASERVPVYINHLYYVLTSTPIPIEVDAAGSLTVIEAVPGLHGSRLHVAHANGKGDALHIDPMEGPMKKNSTLNSVTAFKRAKAKDFNGAKSDLVDTSQVGDAELHAAATVNNNLANAYKRAAGNRGFQAMVHADDQLHLPSHPEGKHVDAGDLFRWLEHVVHEGIELVERGAFWHFVVKIAGEFYHAVLDCVEKVVGAVKWLYNKIKVAIEHLIKFLQFVFDWDDIKRTQQVLHNVLKRYMEHMVGQIPRLQHEVDDAIDKMIEGLEKLMGFKDWSKLGDVANKKPAHQKPNQQTASTRGDFLRHHLSHNARHMELKGDPIDTPVPKTIIDAVITALKNEAHTLSEAYHHMKDLIDHHEGMTLGQILAKILGILAIASLETMKNLVDALFQIMAILAKNFVKALDTEIYIPVVSEILHLLGVHLPSIMDIISWVGAVPATIIFKVAAGHSPFPDNEATHRLIHAKTWEEIAGAGHETKEMAPLSGLMTNQKLQLHENLANHNVLSAISHFVAGTGYIVAGFLMIPDVELPRRNGFTTAKSCFNLGSAIFGFIANALDPRVPSSSWGWRIASWSLTLLNISAKVIFSGAYQKKIPARELRSRFQNLVKVEDSRAVGSIVNVIIAIPQIVCTVQRFVLISELESSKNKELGVLYQVSKVSNYVRRFGYCIAANDPEEITKQIFTGLMFMGAMVTGVIHIGLGTAKIKFPH